MINKLLVISISILSYSPIFSQNTYYVAPSTSGGNNSNSGTLSAPFETLAHAVEQLSAGDILYVREGVYRETITIDEDGNSGSLITIQNYNNEVVTVDGTTDITGSWNTFNDVPGVFQLSYSGDITQLFVDDEPMVNARWPNAQFLDDSIFSHSTWAEGDEGDDSNPNSIAGSLQIDEDVHDPGSLNLQNSIGILNIGSFKTETVQINGHTQNGLADDIITYTHNTSSNDDSVYQTTYKDKHHYYYFEGKLDFLDVNNEWFHDKLNNILYLFPDNGNDPSNRSIKAKNNDYAITLSGANYIKIKGINFFATTINLTNNSDDNIIEECNFYFPSASKRMLGLTNGLGSTNVTSISNNSDDNTIKKCLFENAEGEALVIQGDRNTIENNYFHHIDWSASDLNGLMVTIYCTGDSTTFTKNTIHTTGASATVLPGKTSVFSYNKVTNTGLLQSDGAVFQGTKNYVEGSKVHHNFVYDTEKYAFRYDAPGGDAAVAGSYGIMHHNIADNTNGLMIKGNNQIIAHNTVMNTINNRNDIIILGEDCSNTSTWLYNNLAKRIGSHRSSQSFSLADDSPMPMATIGYIEDDNGTSTNSNDDFWRECVDNDVSNGWTATIGNGSSQTNIDQINVSRSGISYHSNIQSLINYDSSDGKSETDYIPNNNNIIVDQGVSPTNSVDTNSMGGSDTLDDLVPHTNIGLASDIGALEYGATAWTAGIDWTPKFKRAVWKTDASSTDWHSPKNWTTENVPTSNVNVLIPTGATNYPVITGSNATCNNLTIYPSANLTLNSSYSLTIEGDFRIMGIANINGDIIVQSGNFTNNGTVTLNSDADEFASIIVGGTSSGNIIYNRYVNTQGTNEWDLVGSPVGGLSVSSFVGTNSSVIATSGSTYALGYYDNSDDSWTNYTTSTVVGAGNLTLGKGYQMASTSGATMAFTGTVATSAQTKSVINYDGNGSGRRWNLVANPFPSYINLNDNNDASNNFLTVNSSVVDGDYLAVYGYDADGTGYSIYNHAANSPSDYIAPGQAFFVAAASSSSDNISFTTAMRTTSGGDDFVSGRLAQNDWSNFYLRLDEEENFTSKTQFYFDQGLSLGLDSGYDAGALNQSDDIMSRLPDNDQGIGMAINAMGLTALEEETVIPLVLNRDAGVEFSISFEDSTIPEDVGVYLEDTLLETLTDLRSEDFTLTPESDLSDMGRFYLRIGNTSLGGNDLDESYISIYKAASDDFVTIEGLSNVEKANVQLFNIIGQEVLNTTLNSNQSKQRVSTSGLVTGVYVIRLQADSSVIARKIIIN